jgi:uncharacterized repeat protein (TIGR03803 family)
MARFMSTTLKSRFIALSLSVFTACCHGAIELTPLVSFDETNGVFPYSSLAQDKKGNLYGTTMLGGLAHQGTLFKITLRGELTTLVSFDGKNGAEPHTCPVIGRDGNLYGTTPMGGLYGPGFNGTIYKLTPEGAFTLLFAFDGTNGGGPGGLIQGQDGNFYGTTFLGGGTLFKITPEGNLTTLVTFDGSNGALDFDSSDQLVQMSDGSLYGTTPYGGLNNDGTLGFGTVFRLAPDGEFSTLLVFAGTNGGKPNGLIKGSDGNLYGTTIWGGAFGNGTVFRITTNGVLTTLHHFTTLDNMERNSDGAVPMSPLVEGKDGNFYGTTDNGGGPGNPFGTMFSITPGGEFNTLLSFGALTNTYAPPYGAYANGLTQTKNGDLYGTTFRGGYEGYGTVFRITHVRQATVANHPGKDAPEP